MVVFVGGSTQVVGSASPGLAGIVLTWSGGASGAGTSKCGIVNRGSARSDDPDGKGVELLGEPWDPDVRFRLARYPEGTCA
jgi:hypothetical protein